MSRRSHRQQLLPGDELVLRGAGADSAVVQALRLPTPSAPDRRPAALVNRTGDDFSMWIGFDLLGRLVAEVSRGGDVIARRRWGSSRAVRRLMVAEVAV